VRFADPGLTNRAAFPSDTVSTHFIWPPGVGCLERWGLLKRTLATNCPVIRTIGLELGEFELTGELPPFDGVGEIWRRAGRCWTSSCWMPPPRPVLK
jgi:hypothetical protein